MGVLMEPANFNLDLGRKSAQPKPAFNMSLPGGPSHYGDTLHSFAVGTRETEFGRIVEPIGFRHIKPYQSSPDFFTGYNNALSHQKNGFTTPFEIKECQPTEPLSPSLNGVVEVQKTARAPPKKKWIKEYLEEEPQLPIAVAVVGALPPRTNGLVLPRPATPPAPAQPPAPPPPPPPPPAPPAPEPLPEHSRPRTDSHGPPIPSPPPSTGGASVGTGVPRAGTREVHNKLEKNRRAHLKECFELLKRQLPATPDDKKTSNLSILGSAIRYIQVLRRKERECEHEMERLAREKIAAQQRLATLRRDGGSRTTSRPRSLEAVMEDRVDDRVNGQVLGIPLSITSSPPRGNIQGELSPPRTLNLSTKLRTLPIQITPTSSQVVRTAYGARHNTLTLTALAPSDIPTSQNGQPENGLSPALGTALVHPAHLHLPLSQVVTSGGLVMAPTLQLLSAPGTLRMLPALHHPNGLSTVRDGPRLTRENGITSPSQASESVLEGGSVVMSGLAPLMVSQAGHLLHTHTLTHKMVETQMMQGSVAPLTVSAQYLSATTIVKPMVVVSSAPSHPSSST